jgi:hypothetical protein
MIFRDREKPCGLAAHFSFIPDERYCVWMPVRSGMGLGVLRIPVSGIFL